MFDITTIIEGVIALAMAVCTGFLIPLLKSKFDNSKMQNIEAWIAIAVEAVEQVYSQCDGATKKLKVLEWLKNHNITYNAEKIDSLIEAKVYELKNLTEIETIVE